MNEKPLIRRVREAAGMSQQRLAQELDKSIGRIRQYESGAPLPEEVLERLKTVAAAHGAAHVVLESHEWQVKNVIRPGERLISEGRQGRPDRARLHQLMDQIFDSGNEDAIRALKQYLSMAENWLTSQRGDREKLVQKKPRLS